jgi:hypothetical protein
MTCEKRTKCGGFKFNENKVVTVAKNVEKKGERSANEGSRMNVNGRVNARMQVNGKVNERARFLS